MTDNPAKLYEVTHQEVARVMRADGTYGDQWTVHAKHHNGTPFHVTLPGESFNAKNVHDAILPVAQTISQVAALPAEPTPA